MKLKKICALLVSAVMAIGTLAYLPAEAEIGSDGNGVLSELGALTSKSLEITPFTASAASTGTFRRPISNVSPAWFVHIDSWNYPDPEKIIDLVPDDILPYVVFNISLSINWDSTNNKWLMVQDGIETARSWMKACADKGVWTMIQPASGGQCHFPDYAAGYDL